MAYVYDDNSIKSLEGAARVRKNPQTFLGSRGLDGAKQTVYELVGNATDEKLAGFGTKLDVTFYEDDSISLRDYGRGVPLGWNEKEKQWNYFLIYEELFAGGKYEDNQKVLHDIDKNNGWDNFNFKDYPYLISIGMHGVGGACTQYTSEYFDVTSVRQGKASSMHYEKGKHVWDELKIEDTSEPDGTFIHWKPDQEVFDGGPIPDKWVDSLCKELAMTTGFDVHFVNRKRGSDVVYEGSNIIDDMREKTGYASSGKYFLHKLDNRNDVCICEAEAVIGPGQGKIQFYNNLIRIHGGSHSLGLNGALSTFFKDVSKEKGRTIKDADYAGKFSFTVSTLVNKMSARGQTKESVDDEYILTAIYNCVLNIMRLEHKKGSRWFEEVIDEVVAEADARVIKENAVKNFKEVEKSIKRHKASDKFVPSIAYEEGKYDQCEYFIVEGDSAGGRVKSARDSRYQCILKIRGKSLNVYKATLEQLLANKEIKDMIVSLGCGINLDSDDYGMFDINKLRVKNIYFLADADIDGKHINMLLFLIFYRLFPELIYQGKVWVVHTPLYVITTKGDEAVYCMDEAELAKKREEIGEHNIVKIDRFKGLGETEADVLWETTLNPANRIATQITLDRNDSCLDDTLSVLFGKSTDMRKRAILGSLIDNFDEVVQEMLRREDGIEGLNLGDDLDVETIEL